MHKLLKPLQNSKMSLRKNKGSEPNSKQKEEIYKQYKSKIDEEFEKAQKEQENESKLKGRCRR